MEPEINSWEHIESLIRKEKEIALGDFRRGTRTIQILKPERPSSPYKVVMASAAVLLMTAALITTRSFWSTDRAKPASRSLSAFLMEMPSFQAVESIPDMTKTIPAADSSLVRLLEIITVHSQRAASTEMKPVHKPFTPVAHANPAAVQRKIKTVISENRLEYLITHFCSRCKET